MKCRVDELESCFKQFPDVPEEVIIKEDCTRYGLAWTDRALKACDGYQVKSYFLFQWDRSSRKDMAEEAPVISAEEIKIFGGPYKLMETVVANHLSVDSPYLLDVVDGKLKLLDRTEKNNPRLIADVKLRKPPSYYHLKLEDGRPYWDICAAPAWGFYMFITVLRNCQYWGDKEECKFCDINANAREQQALGRPSTVFKKPEEVAKVVEAAFAEYIKGEPPTEAGEFESVWERGPHQVQISGGTVTQNVKGKNDTDFYIQYVEAVKEKIGSRFPVIVQTAAKDKKDLKRLKAAGADVHMANFEVWDKRLFQIICPGKERFVSRDEWIRRLCDSVYIFGEGGVFPGFVAGVEMAQPWGFKTVGEAVKSTTEGMEYLMSHGVIPRPITWVIEPLSALAHHPMIPLEYHIEVDRNWYELWRKYALPDARGFGHFETGRGRYSTAAFCDMGPHKH